MNRLGRVATLALVALGVGRTHAWAEGDAPVAVTESGAQQSQQLESAQQPTAGSGTMTMSPEGVEAQQSKNQNHGEEASAGEMPELADNALHAAGSVQAKAGGGSPRGSEGKGGTNGFAGEPVPTLALPTGADKSGVTSQAISVPKGSGTIQGMEESFSAQLSTGIATFSVPLALPAARGGAQPSLALAYSSGAGTGVAGLGWSIGVPFIARQTDRGVPRYDDQAQFHHEQDRFVFNGGQELVPICVVAMGLSCSGALANEAMPVWATGWQYFRPRVEGSFLRFFWSPDHLTWRVQDKSGVTMELGAPLDGSGYANALERNPDNASEVYRWHLVRQYDTFGSANPATGNPAPANVVVYRYLQDGGMAYLSDIYDTPPAAGAALGAYAHRTRLVYEARPDPTRSYRSGFLIEQRLRLSRVDVGSKTFAPGADFRRVRRYHLAYEDGFHTSLLASVQVEGRCSGDEGSAPSQDDPTDCPRLPAMKFEYSHVASAPSALGYEAIDEMIRKLGKSPPHSLDEALTDLFDVNGDALPDVIVTAPALFAGNHGLFVSGANGTAADNPLGIGFAATSISVSPNGIPPGTDSNVIKLSNGNVAPFDLDGDGLANLVHMPVAKKYEVFNPVFAAGKWSWQGRTIPTASQQDVKIDFTNDAPKIRVVDVDFDGLVDVVVTTGTEVQTFFALGRYPGGDGQFGRGTRDGAASAVIFNTPVTSCLPWSATPIQFSDPDVFLADMNGDGITDIVRVRSGDIRYWPGRGNGFWGTGKRDDCPAGSFGQERHISMTNSPNYQVVQGDSLLLDDVNGDGLADVVETRFNAVDIYLNVDGKGWTARHIIFNTPPNPASANRVRLVDVDGSGTRDVLWGDGYDYKYIDLQGGTRPGLLTRVDNGLGKSTHLEYSTSTAEMLAAEASGDAWASKMPTVVHVVKRVTETDNHAVAGKPAGTYVTEYSYRDPVFEGRQREFRGFKRASAKKIGDENSPTDITETEFLLGECVDETATGAGTDNGIDDCSVPERWRDNPREALKGLPTVTERRDESGRVLSTDTMAYRLRKLYTGMDGREVRHAFETSKTTYLYHSDNFVPATTTVTLPQVQVERAPIADGSAVPPAASNADWTIENAIVTLKSSAGRARIQASSQVDVFGNRTIATANGCTEGCPGGNDEVITTTTVPTRPAGDPTGWLWRTGQTYVQGSAHGATKWKETLTTYEPTGVPIKSTQKLTGSLPLDRFHAIIGSAIAPPPADASTGADIVWTTQYDSVGNVIKEFGPNGRCREVSYDSAFTQLPIEERMHKSGCGSTAPLTTKVDQYDRGLALATDVRDMQGQPTVVTYDGFGRLITLTRPHPDAAGMLSPQPSVIIEYFLPPDLGPGAAHSIIHTKTQDAPALATANYLESWAYVDGFGRTLVTLQEADEQEDGAPWIASEQVAFDKKGTVERKHLASFYSGAPMSFPFGALPSAPYGSQRYDAFGRQKFTTDLDGTITLYTAYHALSTDMWDGADLEAGPHGGTFASEAKDGHGRTAFTTERFHEGSVLRERVTRSTYLPTNEPEVIKRELAGSSQSVTRWMRYDSQARMVLNVEPNTTGGFTSNPSQDPSTLKAWRYAYNDAGDLVGTSDARGCGINFAYDGLGRLLTEDYSPCEAQHQAYSAPNVTARAGVEVLYHYDTVPLEPAPIGIIAPFVVGRLVAVYDRASLTVTAFDGRGRSVASAVKVAKPGAPTDALADRYADRWYEREMEFDSADREVTATNGTTVAELGGVPAGASGSTRAVTTAYSKRGTVKEVGGSYGTLVTNIKRAPDGLLDSVQYGDLAETKTDYVYDTRRRVSTVQTYRGPPQEWTATTPPYSPAPVFDGSHQPTFQLLLQDDEIRYDVVSNPVEVRDWRIAEEWAEGAKPVSKKAQYDDLYRLKKVEYQYATGDDVWKSPFEAENSGNPALQDSRRAKPSPHVAFDKRVLSQSYSYDWLGNTAESDDDAHGFYDRSLGTIGNGPTSGTAPKPYQLTAADNLAKPGTRTGRLAARYDDAGNLTRLAVDRGGPCLPTGSACNQLFAYEWDEVGRLTRARRWDISSSAVTGIDNPPPTAAADADLSNAYDAGDQRVIKTTRDAAGAERYTLYIFETLELRRAEWITGDGAIGGAGYQVTPTTEVGYLFANGVRLARLVYEPTEHDVPTFTGAARLHVFFELRDHLGSTSVVLDKATGELVERSTYEAYGSKESDYRPERWSGFREDYGFSGKEQDSEVGLTYFGKRFLSTNLQRWVSADPLEVHTLGSGEPNVYAYVSGRALKAVDPLGLSAISSNATDSSSGASASPGCEAGGCGGATAVSPAPAPVRTAPSPAPQPSLGTLMGGVEAYADKVVQQLQHSAQAVMPGVQTGAELASKLDAAQAAHAAAQRGDVGGMLSNGFDLTPAGQFAVGVKGLGERIGTAAFGVESAWKAGDVAGTVRHGMDLKRGAEESGVMVAGIPAGVRNFVGVGRPKMINGYAEGSFSITDWSGYPAGLPRPRGPMRLLAKVEWDLARRLADGVNRKLRKEWKVGAAYEVHEVHPVKFGGNPIDPNNKRVVPRSLHRKSITPWWNSLQRWVEGG